VYLAMYSFCLPTSLYTQDYHILTPPYVYLTMYSSCLRTSL